MVRHDDKPDARRLVLIENFVQPIQQNTFGMVMVQKFAPAKDGKCDEMDIQLVIDDSRATPVASRQATGATQRKTIAF